MVEIKSLSGVDFDTIFDTFSQAFADYEITLSQEELSNMLNRRGFNANLSFGAFDKRTLVSFTCNGIGTFNGVKTAYDTGTGTLKEYRSQGLASRVFNESIPTLVQSGVKQYLLEVLQHNTNAISVYKKQGFTVKREFNYFVQDMDGLKLKPNCLTNNIVVEEISLNDLKNVEVWFDFSPSWQNNFEAIERKPEDFIAIGAKKDGLLIGYGIVEPSTGDITQIAVDKNYRRKGVGTAILHGIARKNKHSSIKLINSDISCVSITQFLESNGISLKGKQFEMTRALS